jgi:hypothetical protein
MFRRSDNSEIQGVPASTPTVPTKSRGLAAAFGLDPRAALLMVIVDTMLFGGDVLTLGALIPIGIAVGVILGLIIYKIQRHWYYNDDHESALIKALICALLTAIPSPLGPVLSIPAGLLGIVKAIRRR